MATVLPREVSPIWFRIVGMKSTDSETLYRRLQEHLDRMPVGFPATQSGVEIRILQRLFSEEEAELALGLSPIPEPVAALARRFGADPETLEQKLKTMEAKGLILGFQVNGEARYGTLMYVVGIYERQVGRLTPELERDHEQYTVEALGRATHTGKTPQMRIVPVNREIALDRKVASFDRIRAHVEASPGPFGSIPCICRKGKDLLEEPCRQTELRDNCLMIGPAAEWAVQSGNGRAITKQEMLDLLDAADRDGLVLQPENTQSPMFVCCCCGCCCGMLLSAKRLEKPADYFSSNFYAAVEEQTCEGCGDCIPRCQMDAISLPEGRAVVERGRCIGCALCVSTCPSGAMRLEPLDTPKQPPSDTPALYMQMFRDRFGPWALARLGVRKILGMKP
jgi:Na+-translocating ferredoxin:NAD+ oxidoreductase subunit B